MVEVVSREDGRRRFPALTWRAEGAALVGTADDGRCAAAVRLQASGVGLVLEVDLRYDGSAWVEKEAVRLRLPGTTARAVGHDLALRRLAGALRVDRGTPVFLVTSQVALVGGPGLAAARYRPVRGGVEVELVLDDGAARPFGVYQRCFSGANVPADPACAS